MKTLKKLLFVVSSVCLLAGCNKNPTCSDQCQNQHEHTFDLDHWKINNTHHWHESTCEHKGLASDLGEHTYNSNGVCTACGHIKDVEMFTFTFKSDYCELNNNEVYQEGEEVELTLTLKDAYKASLDVPSEIEVYSNGLLLTNGAGYTYVVQDNTGTLSLKVNGNIVVQAFRTNDESAFQISEQEFENAMNISDLDYFQYEMYYARYSSYSLIMYDAIIESSPLVIYRAGATLTALTHSSNLNYQYQYIENEDSNYTEYTYSDSDVGWEKSESTEQQFNRYKTVNLTALPFISSDFTLSYEAIKDHYNHVNKAYELEFTAGSYNVKFAISFYNGKIIDISYSDDSDYGFIANVSLSYDEKDVVIPEEVKPHIHTFSTEWSKDESYHWHAATCEHTDLKDSYGKHTLDKNGTCTVCGYTPEKLYPVVTKLTTTYSYEEGPIIDMNTWADDYSSVITRYSTSFDPIYLNFDAFGNVIEQGSLNNLDEFELGIKYTYENNLKVSELHYLGGELTERRVYTYDEVTNDLKLFEIYKVNGDNESLFEETVYEQGDNYKKMTTTRHKNGDIFYYCSELWEISYEGGNRKETFKTKYSEEAEFKEIGYNLYNELDQFIMSKDTSYIGSSSYYEYTYITYTDDGELETVTLESEDGFKQKTVYTYDENGFKDNKKVYDFNDGTQAYDILVSGCDYVVDSKGTVLNATSYVMEGNERKLFSIYEYEVAYIPVYCNIDYPDYNAETKGTYNFNEIEILKIIG